MGRGERKEKKGFGNLCERANKENRDRTRNITFREDKG